MVGVVGVEPTKPEATDLQSAEFTDTQYPDIGVCSGTRTRITPSCFMRAEVPLLRLQTLVRRGRNRTSCPEGGGLQPPDGTSLSLLAHRIVWYGWRDSNPQERRLLKPLAVPIYLSHTRIVLLVRGERIELQALREMIYSHPIAPAILIDTPECLVPSSGFEPEKALPFERSGCTNLPKPAGHGGRRRSRSESRLTGSIRLAGGPGTLPVHLPENSKLLKRTTNFWRPARESNPGPRTWKPR